MATGLIKGTHMQLDAKGKPIRSNTKLIISGVQNPSEKFIVDPDLPALFTYQFGGPGDVVIAKGMMVGLKDSIKDWETGYYVPVYTIADPLGATQINPIGMAPYNVYAREEGFLNNANQPTVITHEYVQLPYIPNVFDCAEMSWGAVTGAGLKNGDYVTPVSSTDADYVTGNLGKLRKWISGTDKEEYRIGQVYAIESLANDQPQRGWEQFVTLEPSTDELYNTDTQTPPNFSLDDPEYAYDPNYKWPLVPDFRMENSALKLYNGVPGLTDGLQIANRTARGTAGVPDGNGNITVNLINFGGLRPTGIKLVTVNGVNVPFVYDNDNKTATFAALQGQTYTVYYTVEALPGTEVGLDFLGAVGAARIRLIF